MWMLVVAVAVAGRGTAQEPSCTHELVYEPFGGLTLVSVEVGPSPPLDFVLDSGATQSALTDRLLAAALGLRMRETGLARGMGPGATRVLIAEEVPIRSLGFEVFRASLVVHDIGERLASLAGREIHGFLGWDLFDRFVVELDPVGRRLLLHDPETFVYRGPGLVLPLEIEDRRPVVRARVRVRGKRAVPVRLLVDTGSSRYLTLIAGSKRQLKAPADNTRVTTTGVVGDTPVVLGRVARLELGSWVAEAVETAWVEPFRIPAVRNISKLHGILGNPLLGRYHVFFDYHHGRLILEVVSGSPDTMNEMPD